MNRKKIIALAGCILATVALLKPVTAASESPVLRIGVIADAQYCYINRDPNPEPDRKSRESIKKMDACVNVFNSNNLDFVISLGDFLDQPNEDLEGYAYADIFTELDSGWLGKGDGSSEYEDYLGFAELTAPRYHVLGNHDYGTYGWKNRYAPYERSAEGAQHDKYGLSWRYYSFTKTKGNVAIRCIVLDGNEDYSDDYSHMSPLQITWLDGQLKDASKKHQSVLIFCHEGLYCPTDIVHRFSDATRDSILSVLDKYNNIVAWMNGHWHYGFYREHNGIHYLNFKGMVQGEFSEGHNAFSIVEIYENHMNVLKFGDEIGSTIPETMKILNKKDISPILNLLLD